MTFIAIFSNFKLEKYVYSMSTLEYSVKILYQIRNQEKAAESVLGRTEEYYKCINTCSCIYDHKIPAPNQTPTSFHVNYVHEKKGKKVPIVN